MMKQKLNMRQLNKVLAGMLVCGVALTGCQSTDALNGKAVGNADATMTDGDNAAADKWIATTQLARYEWTLVNATDANNKQLTPLTTIKEDVKLNFARRGNEDSIGFTVGCNGMGGSYTLNNNVLTVGNVMSTQMFCQDKNEAEKLLAAAMSQESQLSFKGDKNPVLTQITNDNLTLVWQGTMTAAAKYGNEGETIFLAVSHESKPCPDGTTKECLLVKPISYDEKGLKTAEGDWTLFDGVIEGYNHDGLHNQVLRVKRYDVTSDSKDAQYAYVLDMVVETQRVQ